MLISEIFYSIQAEARHTGVPTVFIRTYGCNLKCNFCDSKYTWSGDLKGEMNSKLNMFRKMGVNKVLDEIDNVVPHDYKTHHPC